MFVSLFFILSVVVHISDTAMVIYDRKNTNLTSMPLDIPTNTTMVELSNNAISQIPLSTWSVHQVTMLTMNYNKLTAFPDLSPIGLTLQSVALTYNAISVVNKAHLEALVALQNLALRNNLITVMPNAAMPALTLLMLQANQIHEFPDVTNMAALTFLSIADNPGIIEIPKNAINGVLTNVYLSGTSLTAIPDLRNVKDRLKGLNVNGIASLSHAGITEMATLNTLGSLLIKGTSLTRLPTSCPTDVALVKIQADPGQLDLCHCSMIWMKMVVEQCGIVTAGDPMCGSKLWSQTSSTEMIDTCTTHLAPGGGVMQKNVAKRTIPNHYCAFPVSSPLPGLTTRIHCARACFTNPLCVSFNFQKVESSSTQKQEGSATFVRGIQKGRCVIVAPSEDMSGPIVEPADEGQWDFYAVPDRNP